MVTAAGAVLQQVNVVGTVATVSESTNTLSIDKPQQYGCNFGTGGKAPVCTYNPMNVSVLTGTVPDAAALTVFKPGDPIVATSIGGAGERWITLAKLYGSRPNKAFVTELVGDPSTIPTPLIGNYGLGLNATPDCTQCTGTTCTAKFSDVTVYSFEKNIFEKTLKPGESFFSNARNDGSSVTVKFVKGQALRSSCPQVPAGMVGIKPVSVYIVSLVPPLRYSQKNLLPTTAIRPYEPLTTPVLPANTTALSTTVPPISGTPTTKAAALPFVAAGALALAGLLFISGKE
jgi:hypothetical protein